MGRVPIQVNLANYRDVILAEHGDLPAENVRRLTVAGIADSGASGLVIPKSVAKELGVPVTGRTVVNYGDRRQGTRAMVKDVELELIGRKGTFQAVVEPKRENVLVGAIVLQTLDLLVDCPKECVRPRDPEHVTHEIE